MLAGKRGARLSPVAPLSSVSPLDQGMGLAELQEP